MKKITFTLFVILISCCVQAQTVTLDWVKKIGGAAFDEAYAIAVDPKGNICISGSFTGKVDFDPSPTGIFYLSAASLTQDIFVCKLDAKGNFMWAKAMGGDFVETGLSIAVDAEGAIYTTGFFEDYADFDPSNQAYNLGSAGLDDIFILKLDASGNFVWAKKMGGAGYDYANSMVIKNSSIYITGTFQYTVDFDPSGNTSNLTSAGEFDIHLIKLDTAGNFIWAKAMGGLFTEGGNSITVDASENIYTTGFYQEDADFDPGSNTFILKSQGGTEIFISKLDSGGNFVWAKRMGGTSDDQGLSIISDAAGNIYSTGFFSNTVDFNPGPPKYNLTVAGGVDIYILKLDVKGNFSWAKQISGTGTELGNCITLDKKGNLYSTGYFDSTADFDPGASVYNITANGLDAFIYKLDTSGGFVWAYKLGGLLNDIGQTLITDSYGDVYTGGYFEDTSNFAIDSTQTTNLISAGNSDLFIHKIKQCESTVGTKDTLSCFKILFNKKYYNTTGVYHDTLINTRGCDSFITLNVTIDAIDTAVIKIWNVLTAQAIGKKYQWIDCNKNYAPISGETKQSFKPAVNGDYGVIITDSICTYTSTCYHINNASIAQQNQDNIQIFPNPTQGKFMISLDKRIQNANLKIYNITGQVIMQKTNISGESFSYDIGEYGTGIYLVELLENGRRMVGMVVVGE